MNVRFFSAAGSKQKAEAYKRCAKQERKFFFIMTSVGLNP